MDLLTGEYSGIKINGTLIWYFHICKRQVWLMAHQLNPEQENDLLLLGKLVHETAYAEQRKEFSLPGIKIDLIKSKKGQIIIGEIKKSSRYINAAKMQVAFYLWRLKQAGLNAKGKVLVPKEKRNFDIFLDNKLEADLLKTISEIQKIISLDTPLKPHHTEYCNKCAYCQFCWV